MVRVQHVTYEYRRAYARRRRRMAVASLAAAVVVIVVIGAIVASFFGLGSSEDESAGVDEAIGYDDAVALESTGDASSAEAGAVSEELATTVDFTSNIEAFYQFPVLQGGCEVAALSCVLNSMGYDVDEYEIADNYLSYREGDMIHGYAGDPYYYGSAFPPVMIDAANAFLTAHGSSMRAHEITGATFDELLDWVAKGYPVLVWTTMYMADPEMTGIMVGEYEWYDNEHCVVLYGVSEDGVLVSDPLDGLVVRDRQEFQRLFEECGSIAYVIS